MASVHLHSSLCYSNHTGTKYISKTCFEEKDQLFPCLEHKLNEFKSVSGGLMDSEVG